MHNLLIDKAMEKPMQTLQSRGMGYAEIVLIHARVGIETMAGWILAEFIIN